MQHFTHKLMVLMSLFAQIIGSAGDLFIEVRRFSPAFPLLQFAHK